MNKIKIGDKVIIISGKEKGKRGKIMRIIKNKVYVKGIVKKIIDISNISIEDPKLKCRTKIKIKKLKNGKKIRICKKSNTILD
ncbi:KOW motif-containing protein [Candidatus Shikimatogenerans bostrichidophilus]|uniref:KOW motif-containing protein n=1 Tax=Candidatus Shikimatogenerans bostrichidophilus TaxID=2943807 RepID=UPI002966F546